MNKTVLLAYFPKITTKRYQQLRQAFSSLDAAWIADKKEFLEKTKWQEDIVDQFFIWKTSLDEEKIAKILEQQQISCIIQEHPEYPELLKQIYDPPICLFVRGQLDLKEPTFAVVGTRKCTTYGTQVTKQIVTPLVEHGITIVSGLALGIDAVAHKATIDARGKTIAVLGSGVDRHHVYPRAHTTLAEQIIAHGGAVISEYPPGTLPNQYTYPRRNRIIAGMCFGTLVVEAQESSGALITATSALENNREVFAIPQNITSPTAAGPNNLLKLGAKPVTSADDILASLSGNRLTKPTKVAIPTPQSPTEEKIFPYLSHEPIHIDELAKKADLPGHIVSSALTLMEIRGAVKQIGGMMYVIS